MALKVIDDGTAQELDIGGSVFLYTPCGWGELQGLKAEIRDEETLRIKDGALEKRLLIGHVCGWSNVLDSESKALIFDHKALFHLPAWVIDRLTMAILRGVQEEQAEAKNSESSSAT